MKRPLWFEVWIRHARGVAAIMGVVAIAIDGNTNLLTKFSFVNGTKTNSPESQPALAEEGRLPGLGGAVACLNSAPLSSKSLRGKVVLVEIWT